VRVTLLFSSTHNSGLPEPSSESPVETPSRRGWRSRYGSGGEVGGGQGREAIELSVELTTEAEGIEALIDGLELDPGGGDVDRAERAEIEVLGAAAAVSHEVDFEKPGAGVVPLGEGAEGHRVPEPGAHVGGRGPAPRPRGARGGEQPAEGGGTYLPDELVDLGRQPQLPVAREPIEELGHEGREPLRPDAPVACQRTSSAWATADP
jgi:hypothetical protein